MPTFNATGTVEGEAIDFNFNYPPETSNLGELPADTAIKVEFPFDNQNSNIEAVLTFGGVQATGCTVTGVTAKVGTQVITSGDVVAPGAVGVIEVLIHTDDVGVGASEPVSVSIDISAAL